MRFVVLGVAAAFLAAGAADAHHSGAMFDSAKVIVLTGVVKEFQWTNPHSWLQVLTPTAGGGTEEWSIELASPGVLTHRGWKPSTLKPGEKLSVSIHPMRNGTPAGNFVSATMEDGRVINTGSGSSGRAPGQADE